MNLAIAEGALSGYFLALARTAGFVLTAPPFNTRGIAAEARAIVQGVVMNEILTRPGQRKWGRRG